MRSWMDTELAMLEELALDFSRKELEGDRQENDHFPFGPPFDGVLEKAHGVGFFSVMLPDELGGAGKSISALCTVLDDICRVDASLGGVIFTDALAKEIVLRSRSFALLDEARGDGRGYRDSLLAFPSFADAEVGLSLDAEGGNGDIYELSGRAEYVVLGGTAARALLPARTAAGKGFSFFLVDTSSAGVEASEPVLSLGLHACPAVDLTLSGARGRLVDEEGEGAVYLETAADRMYAAAAAMACGVMKGSFDEALDYARKRRQGGREIINWSEVRRILADMAVKVRVADMLVAEACRAAEEKEPGWQMGARAASLHVRRMACGVTTDGIQVLGGNGYMEDYGQEKRFRDTKQIQALLGSAPLASLEYVRRVVEGEHPY